MTWPDVHRADYGQQAYRAALTEALWGAYQLLGELSPIVHLLRRDHDADHRASSDRD